MRRLLLVVVVVLAASTWFVARQAPALEGEPLPSTAPAGLIQAETLQTGTGDQHRRGKEPPITPTHLRLVGIDAPVVPLRLAGSTLIPPDDPRVLGWWGVPAGAKRGVTLLVGHTVHTGGGELDDLEDVTVGAFAHVNGLDYEVVSNEVITKGELAERAPDLFDQAGSHRLVVVTCEGYDPATGHYDSNVVLVARPV
jgi:hypothetical protein